MDQTPEERKEFLAELNQISKYTATVIHGEEVSKVRIRQYKKYFNRTYNMLIRIASLQGDINNNSFRFGYGGKILVRKVMLELGVIRKNEPTIKRATYTMLINPDEITLDLVSRIIVEVYLKRNEIKVD